MRHPAVPICLVAPGDVTDVGEATDGSAEGTTDRDRKIPRRGPQSLAAAHIRSERHLHAEPDKASRHDRGWREPRVRRRDSAIRLIDAHNGARVENVEHIRET